jgi:branched-subunit amino acid transport protein AzlD
LKENDLAIMAMKIFKLPAAVLLLLVVACIMQVAVQVTEAARELDDDDIVGGALLSSDEQVPSIVANTAFQVAACKLLRLPCVIQSSGDKLGCIPQGGLCLGDGNNCCPPGACYVIPGVCM